MPQYIVRYGAMRHLGVLSARGGDQFARGARVLARTQRGIEAAEVLYEATDDALGHLDDPPTGQILRSMSAEDDEVWARVQQSARGAFETCQAYVERLGLQMDLIDVEPIFGGERTVVYYLAEQRVDFRELVRQLAGALRTRIEMRQIGVRDEAKLLADYGDCGQPVCCNTHLPTMPPVSMKMAKLQKATLDPTKISGRCGRLKCCLRYEYDTYVEMQRELPPTGAHVVTRDGKGKVLGQEILASQVLLEMEDHRRILVDASEILSVIRREHRDASSKKPKRPRGESSPEA